MKALLDLIESDMQQRPKHLAVKYKVKYPKRQIPEHSCNIAVKIPAGPTVRYARMDVQRMLADTTMTIGRTVAEYKERLTELLGVTTDDLIMKIHHHARKAPYIRVRAAADSLVLYGVAFIPLK